MLSAPFEGGTKSLTFTILKGADNIKVLIRSEETDHHCKYGFYEYGDVQSGHREEGYAIRDRGGMPFSGRRQEDYAVSEYRDGIPGRKLEETL